MTTQTQLSGLLLVGRFAGYMQRSGVSRRTGEQYTMHYIGIETPKENGFPGETIVHQIQVGRDTVNANFLTHVNTLTNKDVSASVYVRAFSGNTGANYNLNLSTAPNSLQLLEKQASPVSGKAA